MAAYHFTAKIHSRGQGASAVRAAAYRAGERLFDARLGVTEDYSRKADVAETAILLPAGAPAWMQDREALWNGVEARERRRDSQVAQELELNLPRELSAAENWRLATDFAREHLVAAGRVCDLAMHIHRAADGESHPHVHILMPLRAITGERFGEKHPDVDWRRFLDRRDRLGELRELWCSYARTRAASLGVDLGPDWDHRSFEARGIDLEGQPKLGATAQRLEGGGSPAERTAEKLKVQRANGERLMARPEIVLEALTAQASTFTAADLGRWVHRHAADDQFAPIMATAQALAVPVGRDAQGRERFSTAELIALEGRMMREAGELAGRSTHRVGGSTAQLRRSGLSDQQQTAAQTILEAGDLACLLGYAGAGKSTMLAEVRRELEAKGYTVRGAALSGIAAENLQTGSGIEARTLHSLAYAWEQGREQLTPRDVLVIDEAGMVGSRQLSRFITAAGDAGAKLILVGDPEQLQAIGAGAAFRAIAERSPCAELTEIRRQRIDWQRDATRELATARTAEALDRYRAAGAIQRCPTDAGAQIRMVGSWQESRRAAPDASRIMLAHTRADVRALNEKARSELRRAGELGPDLAFETTNGALPVATGDRLLFLRNERQLGVKNGTLGTVAEATPERLTVRTDDGRLIEVDPHTYRDFGHGYATTIHKAQGVTVDESFVLATAGFDRHLTYVACSRHRARLTLVHSAQSFATDARFDATLGRERAKDTTLDYALDETDAPAPALSVEPPSFPPAPPVAPRGPQLDIAAPRPTADFIAQHQGPSRPPAAHAPEQPSAPERSESPLTDLERGFQTMKDAAPSLTEAMAGAFRRQRERQLRPRR